MDEYREETIVEIKRNKAFLEKTFGHYDEALKWYLDAILFQQEKVAVEDWDFQLYAEIESLLRIVKD